MLHGRDGYAPVSSATANCLALADRAAVVAVTVAGWRYNGGSGIACRLPVDVTRGAKRRSRAAVSCGLLVRVLVCVCALVAVSFFLPARPQAAPCGLSEGPLW